MSRLCCRSLQTPPRRWKSGAGAIVLSQPEQQLVYGEVVGLDADA
ncbi:hypothetical protein ACQEWB_49455 [Streptomyces sp. CA-249302]